MNSTDPIWEFIQQEAQQLASEEPLLAGFFQRAVLQHSSLEAVVGYVLSETFVSTSIGAEDIRKVITQAFESDTKIGISITFKNSTPHQVKILWQNHQGGLN